MPSSMTPSIHFAEVYELLITTYGEPENEPDYDPLGGLVATILSQHTSDINSGRAYRQLVSALPTWESVRDAPTDQVAEAIRCGGLANIKSIRIQEALHTLTAWQQALNLTGPLTNYLRTELEQRSPEEGWHFLRRIDGVGPKTAACVQMFHMNLPVIPVDTHVHRTSQRLGLIGEKVSADQAHTIFARVTPATWVYPLHVNLIHHGREICHAQRPECARCPLFVECAFVGSVNAQTTAFPAEGTRKK